MMGRSAAAIHTRRRANSATHPLDFVYGRRERVRVSRRLEVGGTCVSSEGRMRCAVEACTRAAVCRGWCNTHYQSWYRYGDPLRALGHDREPSTMCSVTGCLKPPRSRHARFCEMHYARVRRHGDWSCVREPAYRWRSSAGYIVTIRRGHPLAARDGRVYEHRVVLWDKTSGCDQDCYWCGRAVWWFGRGKSRLVTDHVDGHKENNAPTNLVASCHDCNTGRDQDRRGRGDKPCRVCGSPTDREYCSPACSGLVGGMRRQTASHVKSLVGRGIAFLPAERG
jgi:hypothetical protein